APGAVETEFSEVRFKGDKERAKKVYEGYEPLIAEDIADLIAYVVNVPERVTIADVTVYPKAQSAPSTIYRR
ncbi:MAG: NAD(P)-dependent oxidoreductase, partial [Bacteroidales bacterium]|nr:NAD(P)-dependent oxidoreductase [Bacteroidales bacterium]